MKKKEKKSNKDKSKINKKLVKQQKKYEKKLKKKSKENIFEKVFKVNGKFNFISLIKNILLPLGGGVLIGLLTRNSMEVFNNLKKPVFAPPAILFPIVWTILYILMGIAAYRVYMNNKSGKDDKGAYFYYLLQLMLNFLWSIVFFNFRLYGISFILIIILLVLIILTTIKFFKVDKVAGILMIPYILWVAFASVLTFFIWMLNEM